MSFFLQLAQGFLPTRIQTPETKTTEENQSTDPAVVPVVTSLPRRDLWFLDYLVDTLDLGLVSRSSLLPSISQYHSRHVGRKGYRVSNEPTATPGQARDGKLVV